MKPQHVRQGSPSNVFLGTVASESNRWLNIADNYFCMSAQSARSGPGGKRSFDILRANPNPPCRLKVGDDNRQVVTPLGRSRPLLRRRSQRLNRSVRRRIEVAEHYFDHPLQAKFLACGILYFN